MSNSKLPERASLEYLKKLAKERLRDLRAGDPGARLADAQLAIAREYGFTSWRALKAEVDRRNAPLRDAFFAACAAGGVTEVGDLIGRDVALVDARNEGGASPLHVAVRHPGVVRLLLEHGADPNARDMGDNALPLHFAAGGGYLDAVVALLDAGSDVHGSGDAHQLDVIGWATVFAEPHRDVVAVLVQRGARHHIFSAIALGDSELIRRVVEADPAAIHRRLSVHEQEQSALHYAIAPADGLLGGTFRTGSHYGMVETLIELGADLEARDTKGRTPLAIAMLRGDREAMRLLHAAGAREPEPLDAVAPESPATLSRSILGLTPMLSVEDVDATVAWYESIGFRLTGSHGERGSLDFAAVQFGNAEIMFVPGPPGARRYGERVNLWMRTDRLDDLYDLLKRRQLHRARALLAGNTADEPEVQFTGDLYTAFYGQREFSIRDPNGIQLSFYQPLE